MISASTLATAIALGVVGALAHGGVLSYSIGGVTYQGCVHPPVCPPTPYD